MMAETKKLATLIYTGNMNCRKRDFFSSRLAERKHKSQGSIGNNVVKIPKKITLIKQVPPNACQLFHKKLLSLPQMVDNLLLQVKPAAKATQFN